VSTMHQEQQSETEQAPKHAPDDIEEQTPNQEQTHVNKKVTNDEGKRSFHIEAIYSRHKISYSEYTAVALKVSRSKFPEMPWASPASSSTSPPARCKA